MTTTDARDELAQAINKALGDVTGIYDTSENEDRRLADAILRAGYRKPRTITTVEELSRLPHGAIIRDSGEYPLELFDNGYGTQGWFRGGDEIIPMLPAVVLWGPEA